ADRWQRAAGARDAEAWHWQVRRIEHRVDDVLAEADRRGPAATARARNAEQLERGDDGRLERRDAIDAFAQVEGEVGLRAAHALDPATVGVHWYARGLVSVGSQRRLDCFARRA